MHERDNAGNAAAWAQLVLTILDEGRRTATYKLAVLLALMDCCALSADVQGRSPTTVPVRDLAVRVLELYWPQVRPYARRDGAPLLSQSSQPRAITVDAVRALRQPAEAVGARSPAAAERALPTAYADTISLIALNLVQMPLGKLQRPSGYAVKGASDYPRFLYDDAPFHEGVTARQLRDRPLEVVLRPNVGDWLVSLGGLLRPLVELHWTRAVAAFSNEELPEEPCVIFCSAPTGSPWEPWDRGCVRRKQAGASTATGRCWRGRWRSITSCPGRGCRTTPSATSCWPTDAAITTSAITTRTSTC